MKRLFPIVCLAMSLCGCNPIYEFGPQQNTILKIEDKCYAISVQLRYEFGTKNLSSIYVRSTVEIACPHGESQ